MEPLEKPRLEHIKKLIEESRIVKEKELPPIVLTILLIFLIFLVLKGIDLNRIHLPIWMHLF